MSEHPPSFLLEELAAGAGDDETTRHVERCEACRGYVNKLKQAAQQFAQIELTPDAFADCVARSSNASSKRGWIAAASAAGLVAAAAAILLTFRSMDPAPAPIAMNTVSAQSTGPTTVRFKGTPQIAVVRERDGRQDRLGVDVHIRPWDRLRVEVSVDAASMVEVGVLSTDGAWVTLMAPKMLEPGTYFSPQAVRFDDAPSDGWIIAGSPNAVQEVRRTKQLKGVAVMQLRAEKEK